MEKIPGFKWIFILGLALSIALFYTALNTERTLDFHPSWTEAEQKEIQQCYARFNDSNSEIDRMVCTEFIDRKFPTNNSIVNRACLSAYEALEPYSRTILFDYLIRDTRRMIEETAATGKATITDKDHNSLLHLALSLGLYDLAKSLIARGADVNLHSQLPCGGQGDTPLSWTVSARAVDSSAHIPLSRCREMVDILLAHGADIKAPGPLGNPVTTISFISIVIPATVEEKEAGEDFILYLLQKGAPMEWTAFGEKRSVLPSAFRFKLRRVIRYLLEQGCRPEEFLTEAEQEKLRSLIREQEENKMLPASDSVRGQ